MVIFHIEGSGNNIKKFFKALRVGQLNVRLGGWIWWVWQLGGYGGCRRWVDAVVIVERVYGYGSVLRSTKWS